jgi:hypothetical protein
MYKTIRRVLCTSFILICLPALGADVCTTLSGASVVAQDDENTPLGKITNSYDGDSIFNEYGQHGSKYSGNSIWNSYGTFGSEYSSQSPFNKFTSKPPMLIKDGKVLGYLTTNKTVQPSITPNLLKELCKDKL